MMELKDLLKILKDVPKDALVYLEASELEEATTIEILHTLQPYSDGSVDEHWSVTIL